MLQISWVSGTYSAALPLALFLPLYLFCAVAQLTAYRVLMVWVYDRTNGSLLVATLMHASLTASTVFIFTPVATGVGFFTYILVLAAALWVVVGVVGLANGGISRANRNNRSAGGWLEKGVALTLAQNPHSMRQHTAPV